MSFASLGLSEALANAVEAAGYTQPTPVQQRAIPAVLQKRDLMVAAQTGTGKTGGFALPVLELLFPGGLPSTATRHQPRQARVLVLTPTRELAAQVHDSFRLYARQLPLKSACIFGGVGMSPQIRALAQGVDVLVACPGRLLDLAAQGSIDLSQVDILVLDEADRMLDMGFIHDVKKVLARLPQKRQNLLFSATFSADILALAGKLLHNPERIEVTPPNTTVERIEQHVYRIAAGHKRALLAHLIATGNWEQVLVFTRTKHGANRLAEYLNKQGLPAAAIHGNKSQNARTRALADFKDNQIRILVATDIAARGLDIDQLPHVVNYELPNVEEDYVHRIGRTGRAGRNGEAISLISPDEEKLLRNIERLIQRRIPDGDLLGFDSSQIDNEKDKVEAPVSASAPAATGEKRPPRRPQAPRSNTPSTAKTREKQPATASASPTNRRETGRGRQGPSSPRRDRAQASGTPNQTHRNPEEFLDDDVDNFGNRVDYVSPYQNKGNASGKGRRPPTAPTQGRSPAPSRPTEPRSGEKNGRAAAAASPRKGSTGPKSSGTGPARPPRRPARPAGQERQLTPFDKAPNTEANARPRQQPLILRKESKLERLPSLEQLEQLDRQTPTRPQGEKPILLKRNQNS